jgi:hypothetical protein
VCWRANPWPEIGPLAGSGRCCIQSLACKPGAVNAVRGVACVARQKGQEIVVDLRRLLLTGVRVERQVSDRELF